MYRIIGIYEGSREVIDTAVTKEEADYLVSEYKQAYGSDWYIYRTEYRRSI